MNTKTACSLNRWQYVQAIHVMAELRARRVPENNVSCGAFAHTQDTGLKQNKIQYAEIKVTANANSLCRVYAVIVA
jgi:hypothetical protein